MRAALAMLTIGGLGIVPPPLPTQTSAPLTQIGHVVSTPFCTMLSEKARPAIAGLMLNDGLTDYAGPVIARYYRDQYESHSTAADFDIIRLREVAMRMAHNLETVDAILSTIPKPDRSAVPTNSQRQTEELRTELNAIQKAQRGSINVVSGLAETEAMNEFQSRANPLGAAVDDTGLSKPTHSTAGASGGMAPLPQGWGGLAPGPADANDPRYLLKGTILGANATTPYLDSLSDERAEVRLREGTAADAILKMAQACNGQSVPLPSPSAKP